MNNEERKLAQRLGRALAQDFDNDDDKTGSTRESDEFPVLCASNPLSLYYQVNESGTLEDVENLSLEFFKEMAVGFKKSKRDVREFWDFILSRTCHSINKANNFSFLEELIQNKLVNLNALFEEEFWENQKESSSVYLIEEAICRCKGKYGIEFFKKYGFDLSKINWTPHLEFIQMNKTQYGYPDDEKENAIKAIQAQK